jgi:hypothetical protein
MKRLAIVAAVVLALAACELEDANDSPECREWQANYAMVKATLGDAVAATFLEKRPEGCDIP